jgi:hypothetical protein
MAPVDLHLGPDVLQLEGAPSAIAAPLCRDEAMIETFFKWI